MTTRLRVHEKFRWKGWEFRLERVSGTEARWQMQQGKIRARVLYRDIQDPDAPPTFTAIIHMQGFAELASNGEGPSLEVALAAAEQNFRANVVEAMRLVAVLERGFVADEDPD